MYKSDLHNHKYILLILFTPNTILLMLDTFNRFMNHFFSLFYSVTFIERINRIKFNDRKAYKSTRKPNRINNKSFTCSSNNDEQY